MRSNRVYVRTNDRGVMVYVVYALTQFLKNHHFLGVINSRGRGEK